MKESLLVYEYVLQKALYNFAKPCRSSIDAPATALFDMLEELKGWTGTAGGTSIKLELTELGSGKVLGGHSEGSKCWMWAPLPSNARRDPISAPAPGLPPVLWTPKS